MLPDDFTFAAGHRVGIVIGAQLQRLRVHQRHDPDRRHLDTMLSKIKLPIIGGYSAAVAAGLFGEAVEAPVGGTVPATLSLSLGAPGHVRRVHAGHHQGVHGRHDRERHLHRGRRGPHASPSPAT